MLSAECGRTWTKLSCGSTAARSYNSIITYVLGLPTGSFSPDAKKGKHCLPKGGLRFFWARA